MRITMKVQLHHSLEDIISLENLLLAWSEFIKDKRKKKDVQEFSFHLMDNILSLYRDLNNHTYKHGKYQTFNISDPKPRKIHKASVRDRLLHHALYRKLYPFFEKIFAADSFSCRLSKGTHKALNRFRFFAYKVSKNNTKTCWVLKGDIKKFFASINHQVLRKILSKYIPDKNILWLIKEILDSFYSLKKGTGLPLGNLTSQLFVNIYMNEFDQFVKHNLKAKYYLRYADDFVILSENRLWLEEQVPKITNFLRDKLKLCLPSKKIVIKTLASGIDFLGWIHFFDHRILRTATKKRMLKQIRINLNSQILSSYLGLLTHGNTYNLKEELFRHYL